MSLFTVKASSSGERFRSSKPSKASAQSSAWLLDPRNHAFSFSTKQKLKLYDEPLLMGHILLCDHERSLVRSRCENESFESSNMILACSKRTEVRVLCADRKGVFDHLHPKRLAMSVSGRQRLIYFPLGSPFSFSDLFSKISLTAKIRNFPDFSGRHHARYSGFNAVPERPA